MAAKNLSRYMLNPNHGSGLACILVLLEYHPKFMDEFIFVHKILIA